MAARRYKLVEVPCAGHPQKDELTLDFDLLDEQLDWIEARLNEKVSADQSSEILEGLENFIGGIKDIASHLGAPAREIFPRSSDSGAHE